jgi:hypothetical protein
MAKTKAQPATETAPEPIQTAHDSVAQNGDAKSPKAAKKGKSKSKAKSKGKSKGKTPPPKRLFPSMGIKDALAVTEAFRAAGQGDEADTDAIAAALGISKKTPKFFYLVSAATFYGLSVGNRYTAKMTLTDLGKQIVHARTAQDEHQARIKAFLTVEPFKNLFQIHPRLADLPEPPVVLRFHGPVAGPSEAWAVGRLLFRFLPTLGCTTLGFCLFDL